VYHYPKEGEIKYHPFLLLLLFGCQILIIHLIHISKYVLLVHIYPHINKMSYIENWWRTDGSYL